MANITIRNLPDVSKENLRIQAAKAGVSLEALARQILHSASLTQHSTQPSVLELAEHYFGSDIGVDLPLPTRHSQRQAVEFDE